MCCFINWPSLLIKIIAELVTSWLDIVILNHGKKYYMYHYNNLHIKLRTFEI